MGNSSNKKKGPLTVFSEPVDYEKFTGSWFVVAVLPTPLEKNIFNPVESYTLKQSTKKEKSKVSFKVEFTYNTKSLTGPKKKITQTLFPNARNGDWTIMPVSWLPFLKLSFSILDIGYVEKAEDDPDEKYGFLVIGHPSRRYFWVLARKPAMDDELLTKCLDLLKDNGFSLDKAEYPQHKDIVDT